MTKRHKVYEKYDGRCAYTGTMLTDDWQIDHIIPKRSGGTDDIDNLVPVQKIVNHYKRALSLDDFRNLWLGGLHKRIKKLPKNPRTENGQNRKAYLLTVADLFGITETEPFRGIFYFEKKDGE